MEESLKPDSAAIIEASAQGEKFWKDHIAAAQQFKGTAREYCKLNGINQHEFRAYRRLFGFTKIRGPRQKAFIKIEAAPSTGQSVTKVIHKKENKLPDPKWVAELIVALTELL
jgi:hypothetical protein